MAVKVGSLFVDLAMNVAKLERDVTQVNNTIRRMERHITQRADSMRAAFVRVGSAITLLAGAGGFGALMRRSADWADELGKMSDRLGFTTESIAALQLQAQLTGTSIETVNASLERMVKRLGEASAGTGMAKTMLERLGLSAQDLIRMKPEEAYLRIVEAINKLSTQSERAAAVAAIFGREGIRMINMVQAGAAGFEEARAQAEQFGLALSRVDAARIEAANDAMTLLQRSIEGNVNTLMVGLAPWIQTVAEELAVMGSSGVRSARGINSAIETLLRTFGKVGDAVRLVESGFSLIEIAAKQARLTLEEQFSRFGITTADVWNNLVSAISGVFGSLFDQLKVEAKKPEDAVRAARDSLLASIEELHKQLMKPLPSESLDAFIAHVHDNMTKLEQDVKARMERIRSSAAGAGAGAGLGAGGLRKGLGDELRRELEQLTASLMTEEERIRASYERRLAIVQQAEERHLITASRAAELRVRLKEQTDAQIQALDEKRMEQIRGNLEQLTASLMSEEEQIRASYERRQEIIQEALDAGLVTRAEAAQLEIELEQQTQEQLLRIAEAAARQRRQLVSGMFSSLEQLMQSGNRRLFEIGKAAAVANTIVKTYEAAQAAFTGFVEAFPGPIGVALGAAAAAAAIAAGMVRVQKIMSTQFGSKGGVTAGGAVFPTTGGGGIPPGTGGAGTGGTGTGSGGGGQPQPIQINIHLPQNGINNLDPRFAQTLADALAPYLSDSSRRGVDWRYVA